jgi:hypothetical protein
MIIEHLMLALVVAAAGRPIPFARRFPAPWIVEEHDNACFIVRDATGQALGYFYFEVEPQRSARHSLRIRINCQFQANAKRI